MWIYFDASMIATTRVYDTPIRQGDIGDELFVVFANYTNFTNKFVTLQLEYPNGSLSPEVFFTIPSSKQFLLPTTGTVGQPFTNGTTYVGANYIFNDNSWFEQFGIHKVTVRVYDDVGGSPNAIESTGMFNFNVEKSVFTPNPDVSLTQYQYLLAQIQGLIQPNYEDKVVYLVRNDEATQLTTGTAVYVSGTTGASGKLKVKRASASIGVTQPNKIFGVVADPINSGADGYVVIVGLVGGFDTTGFTAGENVYLSTTAGQLTATAPADPNHRIIVGIAERIQSNTGSIYVRIQMGLDLGELCDVNTGGVVNGSVIRYNSATGVWIISNVLTTLETQVITGNMSSRLATAESNILNIEDGTTVVGRASADENGNVIHNTYLTQSNATSTYVPLSQKGQPNGVATLNASGKVPTTQLPGSYDEIKEFDNFVDFPVVGDLEAMYLDKATNFTYRWSGSQYVKLNPSVALGETEFTAYRGDRGKIAYDHSQTTGNPHGLTKSDIGLGNVDNTSDLNKPISTAVQTALNSKANLVSGKIPVSELPSYVDDVIVIHNSTLFANLTAIQAVITTATGGDRRYLATNLNPLDYGYSLFVYLIPSNQNPTVVGNWVLEKTIGRFATYVESLIDLTNNNLYRLTSQPWGLGGTTTVPPTLLPSQNTMATNPFFQRISASFALEANVVTIDRRRQNIIDLKSIEIYEVNNENDFPNVDFISDGKHILAFGDIGDGLGIWKKINNGSSQVLANWELVAADTLIHEYIFYTPVEYGTKAIQLYRLRYDINNGFDLIPINRFSVEDFTITTDIEPGVGAAENSKKLKIDGKVYNGTYTGPNYLLSYSLAGGATTPQDLVWGNNGTRLYYVDSSSDSVYQCNIANPYEPTNSEILNPVAFISITADTTPNGVAVKSDGSVLYILGSANRRIYTYALNSWSIISPSQTPTGQSQQLPQSGDTFQSLRFKPDGTKFYVVNSTDDTVEEWSCSVAWDMASSISLVTTFSVTGQDTVPTGLEFSVDGTKMFIVGSTSDSVHQYSLATAWSISTATYDSVSFATGVNVPNGIAFNGNGTKLFVIESSNDSIRSYGPLSPYSIAYVPSSEKDGFYFITKTNPTYTGLLELGYRKELAAADVPLVNFLHNGNVGVGNITPTEKLDVDGSVRIRQQLYDGANSSGSTGNVLTKTTNGPRWTNPNPNTTLTITNPAFPLVNGNYQYNLTQSQIDNNDLIIITKAAEASNRVYFINVPNNSKQVRIIFTASDNGFTNIQTGIFVNKLAGEKVMFNFNTTIAFGASCLVQDTLNYIYIPNNFDIYYENKGGVQKMVFDSYNSEI